MTARLLVIPFICLSWTTIPLTATAEISVRTQMLLEAEIDGYAVNDDATAISRYLTAIGDRQKNVSTNIADWIIERIRLFQGEATPQLISGYLHFLRTGAVAPPFIAGRAGSDRRRLLLAIEHDLLAHDTPLADLALLFFLDCDDPELAQLAQSTDFRNLRRYPWQIGDDEWTRWLTIGLNPDFNRGVAEFSTANPQWPVVSPEARAALLPRARSVLSTLDLRPPVARSATFGRFMHSQEYDALTFAHLRGDALGPGVRLDPQQHFEQVMALARVLSGRFAATLGIAERPDEELREALPTDPLAYKDIANMIAHVYVRATSFPRPDNHPPADADIGSQRLADVLATQQARILALATYGLVVHQQRTRGRGEDLAVEEILPRLARIRIPRREWRTRLVRALSAEQLAQAEGTDLSRLSQCAPESLELIERLVSLRSRVYLERLKLRCADRTNSALILKGSVPADFARMLEINPHYLDIIGKSLASLSAAAFEAEPGITPPDDIHLVLNDPWTALGQNLGALAHPECPWKFSRAVLRQHYPRSLEWFVTGLREPPASDPIFFAPVEDGIATNLATPSSFDARMKALTHEFRATLHAEAARRFIATVHPVVARMPATERRCTWHPQGQTCATYRTQRDQLLGQLEAIAASTPPARSSNLSDAACRNQRPRPDGKLDGAIEEGTGRYVFRFVAGECIGSVSGVLEPHVSAVLLPALAQDPRLLSRYQLSLFATGNEQQRVLKILGAAQFEIANARDLLAQLRASGLAEYLPDIRAPLEERPGRWRGEHVWRHHDAIVALNIATSALLRTPVGMDLASDIDVLQSLQRSLPARDTSRMFSMSDEFLTSLADTERAAVTKAHTEADGLAAPIVAAINAQQSNSWSIVIFVGIGPTVVPGVSFTFNGVQLSIAADAMRVLPSIGVPGAQIPIETLRIFTPSSPGSVPLLPIPFADSRGATGSRSPAGRSDGGPWMGPPGVGTSHVVVVLPGVQWDSLLSPGNMIGREWLRQQIRIATPLLSESELEAIRRGLEADLFPPELARLIAEKVIEIAFRRTIPGDPSAAGVAIEAACRLESWTSCALAVKRGLENTTDANVAVATAAEWGKSFNRTYEQHRVGRELQRAIPEARRVEDALTDVFRPATIARGALLEHLVEGYLPKIAPAVKWATSLMASSLQAFFDSQATATELDHLLTANSVIQERVIQILQPQLKADWQLRYEEMVRSAEPSFRPAP